MLGIQSAFEGLALMLVYAKSFEVVIVHVHRCLALVLISVNKTAPLSYCGRRHRSVSTQMPVLICHLDP